MLYLRKSALTLSILLGLGLIFSGTAPLLVAAPPQPLGDSVTIKEIGETQAPLEEEGVAPAVGGWRLSTDKARRFHASDPAQTPQTTTIEAPAAIPVLTGAAQTDSAAANGQQKVAASRSENEKQPASTKRKASFQL